MAKSSHGSLAPAQSQHRMLTPSESTNSPAAIPEPATLILVGMGVLAALALFARRVQK